MPKKSDSVSLNDTERNQITACIINAIKQAPPQDTEPLIDTLMPIVKKLKRKVQ